MLFDLYDLSVITYQKGDDTARVRGLQLNEMHLKHLALARSLLCSVFWPFF